MKICGNVNEKVKIFIIILKLLLPIGSSRSIAGSVILTPLAHCVKKIQIKYNTIKLIIIIACFITPLVWECGRGKNKKKFQNFKKRKGESNYWGEIARE